MDENDPIQMKSDSDIADQNSTWNNRVADSMAMDIRFAHSKNPHSWALVNDGENEKAVGLYIGELLCFSMGVDEHQLLVTKQIALDANSGLLHAHEGHQTLILPEAAAAVFVGFTSAEAESILRTFDEAHFDAIKRQTNKAAKYKSRHSDVLLNQLSDETGVSLDPPGYFRAPTNAAPLRTATAKDLDQPRTEMLPVSEPLINITVDIQKHFSSLGLQYSDTQIATFYTALQTKGFVVLSGISGTGKSKIAQGFVEMLPTGSVVVPTPPDGALLYFVVQPIMQEQLWAAIPASQAESFPPIGLDSKQAVSITLDGTIGTGSVILRVLAGGKPTLYISFGKVIGEQLRTLEVGHRMYISTELDEQGDSITELHMSMDPADLTTQEPEPEKQIATSNHLFLSVRPDWRDSTSLLGYYNPLTQTYEWTDFLRFLLRAAESHKAKDGLAWFVILDEMNLAHVEYYFADLLSVIESGRDETGMSREPIRLTYPDTLVDNAPPTEIHLPPNLYIIGTVNMDETTHAFSPKVLDRAFTIELTDVDFSAYPGHLDGASPDMPDAVKKQFLNAFTREGRFAIVDKDEIRQIVEDRPEIRQWLQSLNTELMRDRFHFGYRVFEEIAQFVHNADANEMLTFEEAFDHAVFMKVLPKFTGSRARLRSPLLSVLAWAIAPDVPDPKAVNEAFLKLLEESDLGGATLSADATFPHVASRALQMLETLEMDGFVSFG